MWMQFPSSALQTATDGSGRVSFVMKGLASDRNNAYLVNVAVTNVATGEVATYEVPPPHTPTHFLPLRMSLPTLFNAFHLVCLVTPPPHPTRCSPSRTKLPFTNPPKYPLKTTPSSSAFASPSLCVDALKISTGFVLYFLPAGTRRYLRFSHAVLLAKEDQAALADQEAVRAIRNEAVVGGREMILRLAITRRENYLPPPPTPPPRPVFDAGSCNSPVYIYTFTTSTPSLPL